MKASWRAAWVAIALGGLLLGPTRSLAFDDPPPPPASIDDLDNCTWEGGERGRAYRGDDSGVGISAGTFFCVSQIVDRQPEPTPGGPPRRDPPYVKITVGSPGFIVCNATLVQGTWVVWSNEENLARPQDLIGSPGASERISNGSCTKVITGARYVYVLALAEANGDPSVPSQKPASWRGFVLGTPRPDPRTPSQ